MTQCDQVQPANIPSGMSFSAALIAAGLRLRLTRELALGQGAAHRALAAVTGAELPIWSIPAIV